MRLTVRGCKRRNGSVRGHESVAHSAGARAQERQWERTHDGAKSGRAWMDHGGRGERFLSHNCLDLVLQVWKQPHR